MSIDQQKKELLAKSYDRYRKNMFSITNDLSFWQSFMTNSITRYIESRDITDEIYSSIFAVYDSKHNSDDGWLKVHPESFAVTTGVLQTYREQFFTCLMNLLIVRSYNICELLLLRSIDIVCFEGQNDPWLKKSEADIIHKKIKELLRQKGMRGDTRNNRHLVEIMSAESTMVNGWMDRPIRLDTAFAWKAFFELHGILRNVIAHQNQAVESDTLNTIQSIAGSFFGQHFQLREEGDVKILQPNSENFSHYLSLSTEFSTNTVEFLAGETSLRFLQLKQ